MNNKNRLMIILFGIIMMLFLPFTELFAATETDEADPWSARYVHNAEKLKFSIEISIEQAANGVFFQVSKDGTLKELICYRVTVQNESGQDLGVSYRFKSGKRGMSIGASKGVCTAEKKIVSDSVNRFFPEDHLTESIVGKNKEDYPDTWMLPDQFSFHVWLKDEEENENTSYSGKLDLEIPLGWQTAVSEETASEVMKEISAVEDASVPPIVISIPETFAKPKDRNYRYIGIIITGITAASAVIGVGIVLIRRRKKSA